MSFPVIDFRQGLRFLAAILVALVGLALVNVTMAQLDAPQQAKQMLSGQPPTSSTTKPSEVEAVELAELAPAIGGMAGFVTAPDGAPLSEIEVMAYQEQPWGWEVVDSAVTDPSGHYLVPSLESGIYRLHFLDPEGDYAAEFYGYGMSVDEAADIAVSGDLVFDLDIVLSPFQQSTPLGQTSRAAEGVNQAATSRGTSSRVLFSGGISGTVTTFDGTPLSGIEVTAYQELPSGGWTKVQTVRSDASGSYRLALETAIHRLRFRDLSGTYAFEYYENALTLDEATGINVIGEIRSDINAVLSPAGHITGTLSMFDGEQPQSTTVYVYHHNGFNWELLSQTDFRNKPTSYDVGGLADGKYRLRIVGHYRNDSYDEFYDNASKLDSATDIVVTAGSTTPDMNVVLGDGGGRIAGTVTSSAGDPLSGIEATAYISQTTRWNKVGSMTTNMSGTYQLPELDDGIYTVRFRDRSGTYAFEYYNNGLTFNDATPINVTAGTVERDIDAVLSPAEHITGTLSMFDGQPPDYAYVYVYHHNGFDWEELYNTYFWNKPTSYDVGGLAAGNYRFYIYGRYRDGSYDEFYDNVSNFDNATDIAVTAGSTTPDMNVVLGDGGGRIAGTVTSSAGDLLSGIEATAYISQTTDWNKVGSVTTNMSGTYELPELDDGIYTVRFRDPAGRYAFEYYGDGLTLNDAMPISVTAGTVKRDIDAVLSAPGHITGTLSMFDGQPPDYARVYVYHHNGDNWKYVYNAYLWNKPTSYDVGGLAAGDYRVQIYGSYHNTFYNEFYENADNLDSATDIAVTVGNTTPDKDVILGDVIYNGRITGTVTANDVPQEGIKIDLYQDYTGNGDWWRLVYAHTDTDGNYSIGALKDGLYRVRFSDESGGYASIYYDGELDRPSAQTITIANQTTVPDINASLAGAGSITGTVRLPGGEPAEGISVVAYHDNGSTWEALGTAISNGSGQYTLGGLAAGDYRLYFQDTTRTYRSEYYEDAGSITGGTNVTVMTDRVTPDINATLDPPASPLAEISMFGSGSVAIDPWTGEATITFPRSRRAETFIRYEASCSDDSTPTNVTLWMNSTSYSMSESSAGSGVYSTRVPANEITNATLSVRWECNGTSQQEGIGEFVLYDPSGYITDAATGDPIEGATVTLYRVPNWLPDTNGDTLNCRTVETRSGDDWSSEPDASVDLGVVVNPEISEINGTLEISPTINPQITDPNGYYGWDVVRGCWYVTVQADGYESRVSPVVGVPPEVTDLDLKLTPLPPVADINVHPTSLGATQKEGQTTEQTLMISSGGPDDLEWSIFEETRAHKAARPVAADDQSLSHSTSQEITDLNSTACHNGNDFHRDNSYYRVFDLSGDFDIEDDFEVTSVEFGVQLASGAGGDQPLTVTLYTLDGSFMLANLTEIGSAEVNLPDDSLTIASVPVSGVVPAGSTLVVELFTPSGVTEGNTFFIGSNNQGQSDPSYIRAPSCKINQPTDMANVTNMNVANMHLVMNLMGNIRQDTQDTCPAGDIPWLSVSPSAGTTAPGNSDDVTLLFDSTDLAIGNYSGQLCIQSNDPDEAIVKVPISLTVESRIPVEIREVTPRYGMNDVSSAFYIYGSGFSEPLTVTLGPTQTLDVNFVMLDEDPQRIRAVVPPGVTPGVYDITVQTESGSTTLPDAYEVLDEVTTDDLLSSSEWMWTDPTSMRVGLVNSSIGLNVQHLGGTGSVDSVAVEFRLDSIDGELLGTGYTNILAADATEGTNPVSWKPTEPSNPNDDPINYTICAIIDSDYKVAETNEDNNVVCHEIPVLPPLCLRDDPKCNPDSQPPEVTGFVIEDDAPTTEDRSVTLDVTATDVGSGVSTIKYIEFEYIFGARRWVAIQGQRTWIDYDTARLDYPWELIETYGMRYMQAWAADGNRNISSDGNISLSPGTDVIDLVPTTREDTVPANEVVFYRILLEEGDSLTATMTPTGDGNPDMYIWDSNSELRYDTDPDPDTGVEEVQLTALAKGTYQIEIHAPSDGPANYRLTFGATHLSQQIQPNALNREPRQAPDKPAVALDNWPTFHDLGLPPARESAPEPVEGFQLFLPLVTR